MKAVLCHAFGPRAELRLDEAATPAPAAGQVLIRVEACGVNFFDGLIVEGRYQSKPDRPFAPGSEVAGTILAIGAHDTAAYPTMPTLRIGQRVLAFVATGGYAEEAIADASQVHPLPDAVSFDDAAGMLITYGTAFHALKDRAKLAAGETLLVLGAAGGVGLAAVELGKRLGATIIAAASTDDKLALCRRYGADATINYADADLRESLKALTDGRGVDVVFDPVGGAYSEPAARSLATFGRHLVIGFAAGDIPRLPLNLLLLKQSALIGVFWGAQARAAPENNAANIAILLQWLADGSLHPHVSAVKPLAHFADALDSVMERRVQGKVLLAPQMAGVLA